MAEERGYQLLRRLAAGGMGEVFVARRTAGDFEKRVALKLMLPHLMSADLVERFHAEARLAARMHHPNIVEIFDLGEADGRPFIAMQLVEGVSLSFIIKTMQARQVMMPLPLVRLVASGVCEALAYAHELRDERGHPLRVVHRDVTPSNILLSVAGAVLLTDFGIARVRGEASRREPGVVQGKVAYLAPEQVLSAAEGDERSDVWSAAVTLTELLTLNNPFKRGTFDATLEAVKRGEAVAAREWRADVGPAFEAGLARALSREPQHRFASARAFRASLMDGPVATAPELGEWVRSVCSLPAQSVEVAEPLTGTRSIVAVSKAHAVEPARRRRRWPWVAATVGVLATGLLVLQRASLSVSESTAPSQVVQVPIDVSSPPAETAGVPLEVAPPAVAPEVRSSDTRPPSPKVVVKKKQKARGEPVVHVGYLSADAVPWAEVAVDGTVIDRTPFARFPLSVGRHVLRFRGPTGEVRERIVTITEDTTEAIRVEFEQPAPRR